MTLRQWKYEDILRISELEKECFGKEAWSYMAIVSGFETETFTGIVAEDGGEIIGYGGITVAYDTADIANIAVTEAFRRSGVGGAILEALLSVARAKGALKAYLEVRVSNTPALFTYLKHGFSGSYTRARYYPDGEDCLVMTKEL